MVLLAVQDGGKRVCRLGRPAQVAQGNHDALQLDKDKVVLLGKLAQGKEGEGKMVPDKEMVCTKGLVWHGKLVEVQGRMAHARGSWAPGSLALGSWVAVE